MRFSFLLEIQIRKCSSGNVNVFQAESSKKGVTQKQRCASLGPLAQAPKPGIREDIGRGGSDAVEP